VIIGVTNAATSVSNDDVYTMVLLVDKQVREHVAPAWGIQPPSVSFFSGSPKIKYGAIITVFDDADQAGDLGYHSEGPDADVYGRVFAQPVLQNGGNALSDILSVCSVLSHEVIETIGDSACNRWAQQADGTEIALELCDPVESSSYEMTVTSVAGTEVSGTVSDFVLPTWFDPDAAPGATDYMALLSSPFQVQSDGYVISMTGGTVTENWGETYPLWRIATKENMTSRTARRDPSVVPQRAVDAPSFNPPTSLA
jgi:hypothetical protein